MLKVKIVSVRSLCNGDYDRNIKVECYDHNNSGNHSLIGEFYVTLRQMMEGPGPSNEYDCINPKKKVNSYFSWIITFFLVLIGYFQNGIGCFQVRHPVCNQHC